MVKKAMLLSAGALSFDGLGGEVRCWFGFILKEGEGERNSAKVTGFFSLS